MNLKNLDRQSILVVDDNADILTAISLILQQFGYRVETAGDAHSAFAAFQLCPPALMILDYRLPDLDGIELGAKIRQHVAGQETKLVLLTGNYQPEHAKRATAVGFESLLIKPISMQVLLETIQSFGIETAADSTN